MKPVPAPHPTLRLLNRWLVPALSAAALLAAGRTMCAEVVEDFESEPKTIVEPNSNEQTQCEVITDAAQGGNRVMKFSWEKHQGTHVAGSLAAPGAVIASEPGVYEVTVKVNFEQCGPEVTRLAMRLVDAGNETFQFAAPVENKSGEPGWVEMKWIINTKEPLTGGIKSWGQEVNGVVDFPIKFYGFAVDLNGWKTEGGSLLFDDLSVTKISD
jgi:hypothetical protein